MALTENENRAINKLLVKLVNDYVPANIRQDQYFEANTKVKGLNTSTTDKQTNLNTVSGWGRTIVNAKSSRVRIEDFDTNGLEDLEQIIKENRLIQKSGELHKDCFIYGTGYMLVGFGDTSIGEPEILVTMESPYTTIGKDNPRTQRLESLLKVYTDDGQLVAGSYYTLNEIIYFKIHDAIEPNSYAPDTTVVALQDYSIEETSRDVHNLGFIPAVRIANEVRTSNRKGQSVISRSIRYFIDAINRTYNDLEWNNNFYAFPKRFLSGVDLTRYQNEDGTVNHEALSSFMKDVWLVSREGGEEQGEQSSNPMVGQLTASSSEPYIAVIKQLSSEIVREQFIPEYYLNAGSSIPTAAEAMQASEHPLNLVISEIQSDFSNTYVDLMRIILMLKRGSVPAEFADVEVIWKDTSTISLAARTDALSKLIVAGVLPKNSPAILSFIPWTATQKRAIIKYQNEADSVENRSELAAAIREMGKQVITENEAVVASANNVTGE